LLNEKIKSKKKEKKRERNKIKSKSKKREKKICHTLCTKVYMVEKEQKKSKPSNCFVMQSNELSAQQRKQQQQQNS
jgi:hypothetical protein